MRKIDLKSKDLPTMAAQETDFTYRDIQGWFDFEDIYQRAVERAPGVAVFGKPIDFHVVDPWHGSFMK